MTRDEALDLIEAEYGAGTMEDDPEWTEEMVEYLLEDPHFLD